ncbi:Transcriptional regulator of form adherence 5 [Penicillium subrubescens]|uniref:Transcriptional regulator of form adherence 5 n=1 Tax=Penicillium subrubescens TaxID=1316194 RepID=A0A1Q5UPV6_9EURO|nr:Transcriptional regulator of form adherence 5 [Penicillium subrubescens]
MSPSTGKGASHRRASLKCTYCERAFSRTEHLTRHERSRKVKPGGYRNEKPFSCNYCDATFSRKDVIKRHHLRYHQAIAEMVGVTSEPALPTFLHPAPPAPVQPVIMSPSPQDVFLDFSQGENPAVAALSRQDGHSSLLMDNYIMDAFLPDLDTQSAPDEWHAGNLSGLI